MRRTKDGSSLARTTNLKNKNLTSLRLEGFNSLRLKEKDMVHTYKMGGLNIVIDVFSGSIHAVDDVTYDIIESFEKKSREELLSEVAAKFADVDSAEIAECYDEISALRDEGKLFAEDSFRDMAQTLKEKTSGVVKALCLHIAHTCNLNCSYCFASQGKYSGERAVMSFETGKRALDFLIENSGTRRNLEVDFFGGEPLMNFEVVKQLVAYARSVEKEAGKNFRFKFGKVCIFIKKTLCW